jgi:hypothetical protein
MNACKVQGGKSPRLALGVGEWSATRSSQLCTVFFQGEFVLYLTKHHAIKTYGEVELQLHAFLASVLDEGEWSATRTGRFTPGLRAPVTYLICGYHSLDAVAKRNIPCPCRESNLGRPARSLVTVLTRLRYM